MQITSNSRLIYIIMVVIYGYLEKDNDKVFKLHMKNSTFFLNKRVRLLQELPCNKRRPLKL